MSYYDEFIVENGKEYLIIFDMFNNKHWYCDGTILHRESGLAVEYPDGQKYWFWYGELIDCTTQEEFEQYLKLKAFW